MRSDNGGACHCASAARRGLRYPSDLADAEWVIVAAMIPPGRHGGRRRSVNVREVLNGIFYVLWTGFSRLGSYSSTGNKLAAVFRIKPLRRLRRSALTACGYGERPLDLRKVRVWPLVVV
jgi:Putative transposase of IS4/5 family (DUF4096)